MKLPLSARLLACADFVSPGARVADIGCDHGYLSIHLLTKGIASHVYASDINEAPLQSAMRNAAKFGVKDHISFYLSDGVRNIPRDFDTLVCAGMGGDTMIHILESAPWLRGGGYRLILQCQSKSPLLRRWLSEHDWYISRETALRDGRFLYTVMEAVWQPCTPMSPGAWYFSEAMQERPSPEAAAYYRWVIKGLKVKLAGQGESADPELAEALAELESLTGNPNLAFLLEEN